MFGKTYEGLVAGDCFSQGNLWRSSSFAGVLFSLLSDKCNPVFLLKIHNFVMF